MALLVSALTVGGVEKIQGVREMETYYCFGGKSTFFEKCVVYEAQPDDIYLETPSNCSEYDSLTFNDSLGTYVFYTFEEWKNMRDKLLKREINEVKERLIYLEEQLASEIKIKDRRG